MVSIPFDQGDVFRLTYKIAKVKHHNKSQSLSIRAMSFDGEFIMALTLRDLVSIPFDQGDVFRQEEEHQNGKVENVSIPFDQGDVFRLNTNLTLSNGSLVSIPFDQGDVFRLQRYAGGRNHAAFQTHFPIFLEG